MRILLIGNFAAPYEEEGLGNFTLLEKLREEDNECSVINISGNPSNQEGVINTRNFPDFVFKLIVNCWNKEVVHILSKGFTRLGLLKVLVSILVGKVFFAKTLVTLHSEMFSIFGQIRSKVGGEQTIYLSFSLAHRIIFGDRDTHDMAARYKIRDNFDLIPLFIRTPEAATENERRVSRMLQNGKKVILFSNVNYPSFLFDVLRELLSRHLHGEVVVVVSFSDRFSSKLQHVVEEFVTKFRDNLVFIDCDDIPLLKIAYARADLVIRTMSCEGETFFEDFALVARVPERSADYVYFPKSLVVVKEGDVSDLCAHIFDNLIREHIEKLPEFPAQDFLAQMKELYEK